MAECVSKATEYFTPILKKASKDLKNHDDNLKEKTKLKTYRKEIKTIEQAFFNKALALQKIDLLIKSMADDKILTKEDLEDNDLHKARKIELKVKKKDKTQPPKFHSASIKKEKQLKKLLRKENI